MRTWLWLGLSLVASAATADKTDDIVKAAMAKDHIPGVSLAVVRDGKVVKASGYGFANLEWKIPAAPDTVYQIQSVTKQFTAMAVMMLVEEGKVALDDPIGKYVDGTPDTWNAITVRNLLNQTSGIKDFINSPTQSLRLDVSEEDVLKAAAPRPLDFEPGSKWEYSNTNYHLLAMVIRKVTGKSWGEFVMERICRPLGMNDTRVYSQSAIIPRRAAGYVWTARRNTNGQFLAESVLAYAGGGLCSTVLDMAKWDAALYTERLVKRASLELMWTPAALKGGGRSDYGMGWSTWRTRGHRVVAHSGGHFTGFTTVIVRWPEDRLTVIVLTNGRGPGDPGRIAERIGAVYVPVLGPEKPKPIADREPGVTELLRRIMLDAARGKADALLFTPAMQSVLAPQMLRQAQSDLSSLGALKSVMLSSSKHDPSGTRSYRYTLTYENGSVEVRMVLDAPGKVSGFEFHVE